MPIGVEFTAAREIGRKGARLQWLWDHTGGSAVAQRLAATFLICGVDCSKLGDSAPAESLWLLEPPTYRQPTLHRAHMDRTQLERQTLWIPSFDSDFSGNRGGVPAQGQPTAAQPTPTTAGPHSTDTMNKLDPTVDSQAAQPQAPYRAA
ncbi:uncharacterized protein MAM_06449 [Metarhizium album ARSEF 1941]|uniref:Uncharacterized protein n=1 Tax=Metarhizium album (strain ARSEF 1941) TaxID=1081103 RepID=A0A0B2WNP2_METAS|nr:uncharacterized protein MAM_06449 [Metarhizium album ARSEF 1941]KHN95608.1 hypothetical protein MAM_06449 [Metarhizium album ARSEF 1941]